MAEDCDTARTIIIGHHSQKCGGQNRREDVAHEVLSKRLLEGSRLITVEPTKDRICVMAISLSCARRAGAVGGWRGVATDRGPLTVMSHKSQSFPRR